MNTELEDRLRADMERFTRDIRVPAGLRLQAYRHNRQRRRRIRVAVASGAATAVAAGAVAIAGVSGAFGPAPATPATQTTAYVLRHVENALAPASVDNLIGVSRMLFPPGVTEEPVAGGHLVGGGTTGGATSPWTVTDMVHWDYHGNQKFSAYGPSGQHVFDEGISIANGSATQTVVIYGSHTWWTASAAVRGGSGAPSCTQNSIQLGVGPGNGWPALIRSQLACGVYTVAGRQVVDGIDAVKITAGQGPGQLTLLVDPATYLPIRLKIGPLTISFQWLPPTPAYLAQLRVPVPAGFQQVPPPTQP
jgi:hypothetical protein